MEIGLHNIALNLIKKGHNPILLIPLKNYFLIKFKRVRLPYKILPTFPKLGFLLINIKSLTFFLFNLYLNIIVKIYKIDIFHVTSCYPVAVPIIKFSQKNNFPVIVRAVGVDIQKDYSLGYGLRLNKKVDKLIKHWIPKADLLIATTKTVEQEYINIGVDKNKIVGIPNGVDISYFNSIKLSDRFIKNKQNQITFLTVGRYHKKKGFEILLSAIKILKRKNFSNFRLIMVGDKLKNHLYEFAQELNILDKVIFYDSLLDLQNNKSSFALPDSELVTQYKEADIFVLPSLVESFGIVLIEAMAAELPIITTDGPGCKDVIENGKFGYMVKAGSEKELADGMIYFLENKDVRLKYKSKSIIASKNYDWPNIINSYEKIYNTLLN